MPMVSIHKQSHDLLKKIKREKNRARAPGEPLATLETLISQAITLAFKGGDK